MQFKDPELHYRVNIGLPSIAKSRTQQLQDRIKVLKERRNNVDLEKLARNNKCNARNNMYLYRMSFFTF